MKTCHTDLSPEFEVPQGTSPDMLAFNADWVLTDIGAQKCKDIHARHPDAPIWLWTTSMAARKTAFRHGIYQAHARDILLGMDRTETLRTTSGEEAIGWGAGSDDPAYLASPLPGKARRLVEYLEFALEWYGLREHVTGVCWDYLRSWPWAFNGEIQRSDYLQRALLEYQLYMLVYTRRAGLGVAANADKIYRGEWAEVYLTFLDWVYLEQPGNPGPCPDIDSALQWAVDRKILAVLDATKATGANALRLANAAAEYPELFIHQEDRRPQGG